MAGQVSDLGKLLITLGVDASRLKDAEAAIKQLRQTTEQEMGMTSASLERTANQFQRFGSAASRYLTLPLTLVGGGALKMAADLEHANSKIVALAGVTRAEVNSWKGFETRLSEATNTSRKKIAETLYYVASAGIDTKEALEITELGAKSAAAGLGEMDVVSRLLTYALNAYGKENINAAKAVDALVIGVREGTAEADNMVKVIGDLIPVGSALGVGFEEIVGSLAAMTRTGFNAHKSATALRQIMVSILDPTVKAENALNTWSEQLDDATYSADGLRKIMRDKGLFEALVKVNELVKLKGERVSGIVFGNVRALTGDLSLTGKNIEAVREVLKMTKEEVGGLDHAFQTMTATTKFGMESVKIAAQNALINLGQSMLVPAIAIFRDLAKILQELGTWYKNLSEGTQIFVLKTGLLLAALGPLGLMMAGYIKIFAGLRVAVLATGTAFNTFATFALSALTKLTAFLVANPYVAAIAAIVGAFMLAQKYLSNIEEKTKNVSQEVLNKQKAINELTRESAGASAEERVEIEKLIGIVKSEYASKEMKAAAIKQLNAISPAYLGFITEESILTGKAQASIEQYLISLERKAKAEAAYNLLVAEERKRLNNLANPEKINFGDLTKAVGSLNAVGVTIGNVLGLNVTKGFTQALGMSKNHLIQKEALDRIDVFLNEHLKILASNEDLVASMTSLKTVMTDLSLVDVKDLDPQTMDDLKKRIDNQILAEINYTKILKDELKKRLDADVQVTALREALNKANASGAVDFYKASISKQLQDRKKEVAAEYEIKYQQNQNNLKLLNDYSKIVAEKMALMPTLDLGLGKDGDGEDKVKTLKQRLSELMEMMLNANEAQLPALAKQYVALDNQINKQQALVDLVLQRVRLNNELNNPKTPIEFAPDTTQAQKLEVQMLVDTKKLEFFTNYLKNLTAAEKYLGEETEMVKNQILSLNASMIDTNYDKVIMDITRESNLLGESFNKNKAQIEANNKAIDEWTKLYKDAGSEGSQMIASQIEQNVLMLQRENIVLTLKDAYASLQLELQDIETYERALGTSYDDTNEEIQSQQKYLDSLTKTLINAKRAKQDYAKIQDDVDQTKATISLLKMVKSYEDLNKELKLIALNEKYLGSAYDETDEKLKAQTEYLNKLIKALNEATEGTEAYGMALEEINFTKAQISLLKQKNITEEYTQALEKNSIMEKIHGKNYNDKIGQLDAEIAMMERVLDFQREYNLETEDTIKILELLNKKKRQAEWAGEAVNEAKRQIQDLGSVMFDAVFANDKLNESLRNIGKGFVQGGILGGVIASFTEYMRAMMDINKQKFENVEVQKEMNRYQLEYNILLNDQIRMEGRKNVFITDDIASISKASLALAESKQEYENALSHTFLTPDGGSFNVVRESIEEVLASILVWERTVSGDGLFGTGSHNEYAVLLKRYPDLYDEASQRLNTAVADSLLANDKLWQGQAGNGGWDWLNEVNEWSKQSEENLQALDDALGALVGSMGNDMFSAVSEAWTKGEDAFLAYEQVVAKGLDNIMRQMIWNSIMAGDLMKLQNDMEASFNPITGDMNASDDFDRFLNNTKGKIELVEKTWDDWRIKAKTDGFEILDVEATTSGVFDRKSIAEKIAKGLEEGYKTGIRVISEGGYTSSMASLGGFTEIFGELIYTTVFDNFVKAITEGAGMKHFGEQFTSYTSSSSAGGIDITEAEASHLDSLMASVAASAERSYKSIKPILDKYRTAKSTPTETAKEIFDVKEISQTIFDGIDKGLKLGKGSLGDFAVGFGNLMRDTITQSMMGSLQTQLTNVFMRMFTMYTSADSNGGTTLTIDELNGLEKTYANAISKGAEYYEKLKPILDRYKEQENVDPVESLFDAKEIAQNIFEGIDNGFKLGINSLGEFNKGFGDLMRDSISQSVRDRMMPLLTKAFVPKFDEFTGSTSEGGVFITENELNKLEEIYELVIKVGTNQYKQLESMFDRFKDSEEIVTESMFDANDIAQTIYNGIDQGFKLGNNTLGDFNAGFGELLKTTLSKSILEGMSASLNDGFIKKITEFMSGDSLGGTTLTKEELNALITLYGEVASQGTAAFNALKPIWDSFRQVEQNNAIKDLINSESIATSIMNGIKDGLKLGQGSLGDFSSIFGDLITDVLSKAIIQSMTTQLDAVFMKKALEFVDVKSAGGMTITEEEKKILDPLLQSVIKSGNTLWETFKPIADQYGTNDNNQMTKAVGQMTQDQASLIAGQFTAMRYDLRDMTDATFRIMQVVEQNGGYNFQSLGHLKDISTNTRKTNEEALPALTNAVRETNSLIKQLWQ